MDLNRDILECKLEKILLVPGTIPYLNRDILECKFEYGITVIEDYKN